MKQLNLYWLGGGGGSSVPDGRTVTPVNDVTLLQQCAGISNPTYTKLYEILADTGILQTILSNQNAVNYLVRCKGFIKPEFAPQMTSNTTPSGTATLDTSIIRTDLGEAWNAFDRNNSKGAFFAANYNEQLGRCYYTKGEAFKPISAEILFSSGTAGRITYSDNGTTWTDVGSTINGSGSVQTIDLSGQTEHMYWGFHMTSGSSGAYTKQSNLYELQFYEEGFCDSEDAMRYIGLNNYAANTLLNDSIWCEAICNSTYFERVLNAKVPNMTSNTTPSGVCSDSESSSNAYMAYNNSAGYQTAYTALNAAHGNGYQFPEPTRIYKVVYQGRGNDAYRLNNSVYVQKAKNGSWENIGEPILDNTGNQYSVVRDSEEALTTYRLYVNGGNTYFNSQYSQLWKTIQFYGRKDV